MNRSKKVHKIAISFLLMVGLNQNLMFCLTDSQQSEEQKLMAASCACDPSACMCPPSNGCEHQQEKSKLKGKISFCRPDPNNHHAVNSFFIVWNVPILTQHLNCLAPDLSFTYLDRSPTGLFSQQHITPPDKPPQTALI